METADPIRMTAIDAAVIPKAEVHVIRNMIHLTAIPADVTLMIIMLHQAIQVPEANNTRNIIIPHTIPTTTGLPGTMHHSITHQTATGAPVTATQITETQVMEAQVTETPITEATAMEATMIETQVTDPPITIPPTMEVPATWAAEAPVIPAAEAPAIPAAEAPAMQEKTITTDLEKAPPAKQKTLTKNFLFQYS